MYRHTYPKAARMRKSPRKPHASRMLLLMTPTRRLLTMSEVNRNP